MKEIIIDGVDIKRCKYLNKVVNEEPYCNIDEEHLYTCSSDENCYFKQLKRLEQENEKLKSEIIDTNSVIEDISINLGLKQIDSIYECFYAVKDLLKENKKLTEQNEYYITKQNQLLDDKDFQSGIIEELRNQLEEVYENCNKFTDCSYIQGKNDIINQYKQALEEIREIVSEPCVAGENCITCNSNCTNKDILNKINEVLK